MKTKSFLLGAAALMLATACSNDEVVKVAENSAAIGFSSFVNNSTRADYGTENLPADIQVYGLTSRADGSVPSTSIFNGEVLSKESNWTYSPLRYWVAGNDYSFAAFAPAKDSNVSNATMTADKGLTFTFDNKTAGATEDLLYADWAKTGVAANEGTVEFTFSHMLSRVRFDFASAVANENVQISVSDIQITNAASTADFTGVNEGKMVWENAGADLTVGFETAGAKLANGGDETSSSMYLIPLSSEKAYTVKFNVTLHQKDLSKEDEYVAMETFAHEVTIPAKTYQSSYSYTFKATITDETISENEMYPILFDVVGVNGWTEETAEEVPGFEKK